MNISQGSSYFGKIMDMACAEYPVMEHMNKEGRAFPVRSNFRYSENQKKILYSEKQGGSRGRRRGRKWR